MKSIFDASSRRELLDRLQGLSPDRHPHWGRMTAPEMVCHLIACLQQGLGEVELGEPRGLISRWPWNWLVIHLLPWPKGAKTAPGLLGTKPATWDADVAALADLIERFGRHGAVGAWPRSVVFGRISGASWGVLQHRHVDHHLRQFGL